MIFIHTSTSTHTYCTVYTVSGNKLFDYAWYALAGALTSLPVSNKTGNTRDLTVRELAMQHFKCVMNKHLWTRDRLSVGLYLSLYRCNMGEDCVSVMLWPSSSCGLCSARASSDGAHYCRLHGRVCSQKPLSWLKRRGGWVSNKSINSIQFINKMYAFIMLLAQKIHNTWFWLVSHSNSSRFPNIRHCPSYVSYV